MTSGTILLVEDNAFTRKIVRLALEKRGHMVLDAEDGTAALSLFESGRPDLVLQDLVLPDIDGFELIRRLRALRRGNSVPILAFSGLVSKLEEARIATVGFDDVIVKPIEPSRLIPIIEGHLAAPTVAERFGDGLRIILADDDPIQLKLTRFRLERVGFAVEATADGQQALDAARRQTPSGIVTDVLMPRLDGFGLTLAVRKEPSLAKLPILLVTSSYVDESDRDFARRAGANDLILRTPDHRQLIQSLRRILNEPGPRARSLPEELSQLEAERAGRVVHQLERQVTLNTGLARRCSALASELTVLTGISDAVIKHGNIERALDEAVAACLDMGGMSVGALYLLDAAGALQVRSVTGMGSPGKEALTSFFGGESRLRDMVAGAEIVTLPSVAWGDDWAMEVLCRCGANYAMVVPLLDRAGPTGALFIAVKSEEFEQADWLVFAKGIGNQIAQALSLAAAFAETERAEHVAQERAELLRTSEERFRATFEQAAVGVAQVAPDGRWLDVNQRLCEIVGYSKAELLACTFQDITFPDDLDADLELARQMLAGEIQTYTLEKRYVRKDRGLVWIDLTVSLVRGEAGPKYFISVVQDISARKAAEAEARMAQRLRQAHEELRAAYQELRATQAQLIHAAKMASLGELVAGVAHEINNPLAFVLSHVDTAGKSLQQFRGELTESLSAKAEEQLRRADSRLSESSFGLHRIRDLVLKLRTFSRLDEGERKRASVSECIEAVVTILSHRAAGRVRIETRCSPPDLLECYPALLNQVLVNLVANSLDAIEGPGTISITSGTEGSDYVITVADSGPGIPEELRERVMEPFFTTKGVGDGTGLGLSIAHSIVEKHRGTLTLGDAPGGGTLATIRIPLDQGKS